MLEVTESTQVVTRGQASTGGRPAITHLYSWRTPLSAGWELDPPERPSSMISRQEGDPQPCTSESGFSRSQRWEEGGPPERAPPCQAEEGQCQPLGTGFRKGPRQPQRLPQCCHQGPSRMQATQLWSPPFKQRGEDVGQCRVCLPHPTRLWGGGPSHWEVTHRDHRAPERQGWGADTGNSP